MQVMDVDSIISVLETKKQVKYGTFLNGLCDEEVIWVLEKFNKNNGEGGDKQYLVRGYYFNIYIGTALLMVKDGEIQIDFTDTEMEAS